MNKIDATALLQRQQNALVFGSELAACSETKAPLSRLSQLLAQAFVWFGGSQLERLDEIDWEEARTPPPLLSLVRYNTRNSEERETKQILTTLFKLINDLHGVAKFLNDSRYGILTTAYRTPPGHIWDLLVLRPDLEFNVPDPEFDGRTPWMVAAELQKPKYMLAMLFYFPRIDLEFDNGDGWTPFKLLDLDGLESLAFARDIAKEIGHASGYVMDVASVDEIRESRGILKVAKEILMPQYKTNLRALIKIVLVDNEPQLPLVLLSILFPLLRL